MKAVIFSAQQQAVDLIEQINAYVGSTVMTDPIESDEGWIVVVSAVSTSTRVLDLPSMIVNKKFIPPVAEPTSGNGV